MLYRENLYAGGVIKRRPPAAVLTDILNAYGWERAETGRWPGDSKALSFKTFFGAAATAGVSFAACETFVRSRALGDAGYEVREGLPARMEERLLEALPAAFSAGAATRRRPGKETPGEGEEEETPGEGEEEQETLETQEKGDAGDAAGKEKKSPGKEKETPGEGGEEQETLRLKVEEVWRRMQGTPDPPGYNYRDFENFLRHSWRFRQRYQLCGVDETIRPLVRTVPEHPLEECLEKEIRAQRITRVFLN